MTTFLSLLSYSFIYPFIYLHKLETCLTFTFPLFFCTLTFSSFSFLLGFLLRVFLRGGWWCVSVANYSTKSPQEKPSLEISERSLKKILENRVLPKWALGMPAVRLTGTVNSPNKTGTATFNLLSFHIKFGRSLSHVRGMEEEFNKPHYERRPPHARIYLHTCVHVCHVCVIQIYFVDLFRVFLSRL